MTLQTSLRVIFMVCTPIIPKAFGVTVKSVGDMAALVKAVMPVEISATVTVTAEGFSGSSGSTALAPPKLRVSKEFKGVSGIGVGVGIKGMGRSKSGAKLVTSRAIVFVVVREPSVTATEKENFPQSEAA
jgi:hypothetical protein